MLLNQHALEAQLCGHGGYLARVVRLHATDGNQRVASLCQRISGQVFELASFVAAIGQCRVHVLALSPQLDLAAQMFRQTVEAVNR